MVGVFLLLLLLCRQDEAILGWGVLNFLGGGYGGLWRVIDRPHIGPAKGQGHDGQENAETGNGNGPGTVLSRLGV